LKLPGGRSARTALLLLCLSLLVPTLVWAHQRLVGTSPADGSTETTVPRELRLRFNEPVQLSFTRLELSGPHGASVTLGPLRVPADSASVLVVAIAGPLRAGEYLVQWSSASRDGHPVRGEYRFTIAEGAAGLADPESGPAGEFGAVPAPGQPDPPAAHHAGGRGPGAFQADAPAYVAVRWLNFIAILGFIGAVAFRLLVLRRAALRYSAPAVVAETVRRAGTAGVLFAALALLAAAGRLYAQSVAMHGVADALEVERITTMLARTVWGWGWQLQVVAAAAGVPLFLAARRDRAGAWAGAAVAALALALTPALSGHAAAMSGSLGALAITTDMLHVLSAGGWMGTLLLIVVAGIPAALHAEPGRRSDDVASLVRAFSPVALMAAGLLVLSGVTAVFIHSSSIPALLESRYGTVLLLKLAVFAGVFGTGAWNYLRVQPALPSDTATRHLRFSAAAELGLAAVVLLLTAVLVATARPYEEDRSPAQEVERSDHATHTQLR
jgi:copper transport protein